MASRVDGCTLKLPIALDVQRIRVDVLNLPELGFLENIERVDGQTLRCAFVATTEKGELLATRMREGNAWIEAVVPAEKSYGVMLRNLHLRIMFEKDEDAGLILGPDGQPAS